MRGTAVKSTLFVLGVLASALILALAGFGLGWFLSGQQIASLKEGPGSPSAISNTTANPEASLPKADVPGENFSDLPRYPGSVRVKYERRVSKADLILFDTEYVASAELAEVREFYRGVFRTEGWKVEGLDVSEGEWDFLLTKGDRETVIEIERRAELVEIEIEVSEPTRDGTVRNGHTAPQRPEEPAPTRTPTPKAEPTPTATATASPAPAPDGDDDSDDYDDGFDEEAEND